MPRFLDESFQKITEELLKLFVKKHKDYGKENILDIGELGIAFRINEKVSRLKNLLAQGKNPANEAIEDSWYDIAVYAVIAMLYRRGWFQKLEMSPKAKK
ncbi:MAG: nucleotide modification associated domain-containing protein [Patescibacteria group bacterium]